MVESQEKLCRVMEDISGYIEAHTQSLDIHNRILDGQRKSTQQLVGMVERQNLSIGIHTTTLKQCLNMLVQKDRIENAGKNKCRITYNTDLILTVGHSYK